MLSQEGCRVHGRRQKLCIVNRATIVHVNALQDLNQFISVLSVTQSPLQLIDANMAVPGAIQCLKDCFKLPHVIRVRLNCDRHQRHFLYLLTLVELLHVSHVKATYSLTKKWRVDLRV